MICLINKENLIKSFTFNDDFETKKDLLISALINCNSIEELRIKYQKEYKFYFEYYGESFDLEFDYYDILINVIFFRIKLFFFFFRIMCYMIKRLSKTYKDFLLDLIHVRFDTILNDST